VPSSVAILYLNKSIKLGMACISRRHGQQVAGFRLNSCITDYLPSTAELVTLFSLVHVALAELNGITLYCLSLKMLNLI